MTDDNHGREASRYERGINVRMARLAGRKLPAATFSMRDEGSGQDIGCIPVETGVHLSRRQVDTARQLYQLASDVLLVAEHAWLTDERTAAHLDACAALIDERTAARLDACADILGPPWVDTFMQDLEIAKLALYEARLG